MALKEEVMSKLSSMNLEHMSRVLTLLDLDLDCSLCPFDCLVVVDSLLPTICHNISSGILD